MATAPRKTDKPKVSLNLDALEREDAPEPFSFTLGGRVFTCIDPAETEYSVLLDELAAQVDGSNANAAASTVRMMMAMLGDDYEKFVETKAPKPAWKLRALYEGWREHYGMPDPGEAGALPG